METNNAARNTTSPVSDKAVIVVADGDYWWANAPKMSVQAARHLLRVQLLNRLAIRKLTKEEKAYFGL